MAVSFAVDRSYLGRELDHGWPGLLGAMADKKLGTGFLSPLGFVIGLVVGTVGLVVLAKRLTPPAAGKPLPFEGDLNENAAPDASDLPSSSSHPKS